MIVVLTAALANYDWTLQEAAMNLGARPVRTFLKVTMPQISISMTISAVFRLY